MKRALKWLGVVGLGLTVVVLVVLAQAWVGLGHAPTGERRTRLEKSPHFSNGAFQNPEPIINDWGDALSAMRSSPNVAPTEPVAVETIDPSRFKTPPPSGLRITWFGHSSTLIEIDGATVLTDPNWSERSGPLSWVGPTRWYPAPIALTDLPPIDVVVVSHDHYDHLDHRTVMAMKSWNTRFIVPLGAGAHLEYWGIPKERITEVDWWDRVSVRELSIVSTPVRHATGRSVWDRDRTLWSGYAIQGASHRVYFSGDTGLFSALEDIGERLGPFDVTMIEVGQYHRAWPDWHIGPEQAVTAHQVLNGKVFLPIHWGLFVLASHGWTEPIERAALAAKAKAVTIATPKPGQSFEPDVKVPNERWWPTLPFETAEQHPIVSSQVHFRKSEGLR